MVLYIYKYHYDNDNNCSNFSEKSQIFFFDFLEELIIDFLSKVFVSCDTTNIVFNGSS